MDLKHALYTTMLSLVALFNPLNVSAQLTNDAPVVGRPAAVVNLATEEGVNLVKGQWRYHDAQIVAVDHHSVGADLRPSGPPNRTNDISPHAGAADFSLLKGRSGSRLRTARPDISSLAIQTPILFTTGLKTGRSLFTKPKAAIPGLISASTTNLVQTD